MKLRNIFTALAIAALAFVGCQEKERFLDEVKVSQSYLAFDKAGESIEITVNAIDKWEFTSVPEWITVNPVSGNAGETKVTFTATAAESTREALIYLNCGEATQVLSALQMTEKVDLPITTCADFNNNDKSEDGKIYRVQGTVTSIANTTYGNFYINDGTGEAYIYGTLYEGATQQFSKHGIGIGDLVVVEGPRKNYNGTIELVDVTVISIEKSLVLVDPKAVTVEKEAGSFDIAVDNKGYCTIDVDAEWIKFEGMSTSAAKFTYEAYEVMGAPRTGTITFTVKKGNRESVVPVTVTQYGITPDPVAIAEAVKQAEKTWLSVEGIVTGVHDKGVIVTDEAGNAIYGYVNDKADAKLGDKVLMTGSLGSYKQFYQIATPVIRVISSKNNYSYPKSVEPTEAIFAEWAAGKQSAQFIEATGIADKDNYGAVTIAGHTISPYYISSSFKYKDLYSKEGDVKVTIKGYTVQYDGKKKDLRVVVTSIEEVK